MASEVELGEVFRLGEAAGEADIVREVGDCLADCWLQVSRFQKAQTLMLRSMRAQLSPDTLLRAGRASDGIGELATALDYYWHALTLFREVGDRPGEATALNNIGAVYDDLGDGQAALDHFEQALPILREVRDRASEAATLNNIGLVHFRRDGQAALDYFERALRIHREVGNRAGEAASLSNIGSIHERRRDEEAALNYYEQALALRWEVEDRIIEATTRYKLARVHRDAGRLAEAVAQLEQVVALKAPVQYPDLAADTATLEEVRTELASRGSISGADAREGGGSRTPCPTDPAE